jgi:hypothetical protein
MTAPVRVGELLPGVLAEAIARAGPDYDRWMELVAQTGYCTHPVRLRGRVDHADADTSEALMARLGEELDVRPITADDGGS